jgi:hypothetical protein
MLRQTPHLIRFRHWQRGAADGEHVKSNRNGNGNGMAMATATAWHGQLQQHRLLE